jgi:hypothetical protein
LLEQAGVDVRGLVIGTQDRHARQTKESGE